MRLVGLDTLRGVAALLVLGFHVWSIFGVWPIFSRSFIAVDFFFMLSGYVLARTYEGRFEPVRFVRSRFRRLAPTMAAGAIIGFAAFAWMGRTEPLPFFAMLFFIPSFIDGVPFLLNRPAWSIFFEYVANLGHAAAFDRLSTRTLGAMALACVIVLASTGESFDLMGARTSLFWLGFPRVALPYLIGIILWRTQKDKPRGTFPLALGGLVAGMIPCLPWFMDLFFVLVLCPLIILCGLGGRHGRFLGDISFPLYAVHYPILQFVHWREFHPAVGIVVSLTVAALLSHGFDGARTVSLRLFTRTSAGG